MALVVMLFVVVKPVTASEADKMVTMVMKIARDNITNAVLLDGTNVPEETEEEKAQELVPYDEAAFIVMIGQQSGVAAWCSVEWEKRSYRALMKFERSKEKWSDKQMAYIGLMHGISMGMSERAMKETHGECPKEQAEHINKLIKNRVYK